MERRSGETMWAWVALIVAIIAAVIAAPIDNAVGSVSIDGSLATGDAADPGQDVLAGGTPSDTGGTTGGPATTTSGTGASTGSSVIGATGSGSGSTGFSTSGGSGSATGGSSGGSTGGFTTGTTGGGTGGGGGPTGGTGGGTTGGTTGTTTGGTATTGAAPQGGDLGKGVEDDVVRVGFVNLVGQQDAAGQLGIQGLANSGDVHAQLAWLTEWMNANGGIGGRAVESYIEDARFAESTTEGELQICNRMDQDHDVFAVVLSGMIREISRQCYADAGVLTFDPDNFPLTKWLYESTGPHLWVPSLPDFNAVAKVLPGALTELDYWSPLQTPSDRCAVPPCKLGLVHYDIPNYNRIVEEVYVPGFAAIGHPIDVIAPVNPSDAGTIQAGLGAAISRFQTENISRVIFVGGAPLAPFFMVNAEAQTYRPVYGLTTFDNPRFSTDNQQSANNQAIGARGVGINPVIDVHDEQAGPTRPMWNECIGIYGEGGFTWENRANARVPVGYCEAMLVLRAGASRISPHLTATRWAAEVETWGSTLPTAAGHRTTFGPGRDHAGGSGYRTFRFVADCYCMHYVTNTRNL